MTQIENIVAFAFEQIRILSIIFSLYDVYSAICLLSTTRFNYNGWLWAFCTAVIEVRGNIAMASLLHSLKVWAEASFVFKFMLVQIFICILNSHRDFR